MKSTVLMHIMLILMVRGITIESSETARAMEGYPAGFWSDCPGFNKPVKISKTTLNRISITVEGPGNLITSRKTKYSYHNIKELIKNPDVNFSRPTLFYVGGYLIDHPGLPISHIIGKKYKSLGYNFLILNTITISTQYYPRSVRYLKSIGRHVAEMIVKLIDEGLDPNKLEVLGVSLGAQTMSFIANGYQNITETKLPTLIGIDPAGPCFRHAGPEDRLDPSDADFVNVAHANTDGYGMATPMGHVDFYINGGEFQPGDIPWAPCPLLCSHIRAYILWLVALQKPDSFTAIQCSSVQQARDRDCYDKRPLVTNLFGPHADRIKEGIFYLSTRNSYPYYLGKKGLKKEYDAFNILLDVKNADTFDYTD